MPTSSAIMQQVFPPAIAPSFGVIGKPHARPALRWLPRKAGGSGMMQLDISLAAICEAARAGLPAYSNIVVHLRTERVRTRTATGRLVGLLVHELLLNALRHNFGPAGGSLEIELQRDAGGIVCSVRDDGLGLTDIDPVRRGLGMALVERLGTAGGAKCTWLVRGRGTQAIITIKNSGRQQAADRANTCCNRDET